MSNRSIKSSNQLNYDLSTFSYSLFLPEKDKKAFVFTFS